MSSYDLSRFIEANKRDYEVALAEIKNGRKESHWMWYIFPQVRGLGFSYYAKYYGISSLEEAREYLADDYLGDNIREISEALLSLDISNATKVMGRPDDMKLKSSMTLFALASDEENMAGVRHPGA